MKRRITTLKVLIVATPRSIATTGGRMSNLLPASSMRLKLMASTQRVSGKANVAAIIGMLGKIMRMVANKTLGCSRRLLASIL